MKLLFSWRLYFCIKKKFLLGPAGKLFFTVTKYKKAGPGAVKTTMTVDDAILKGLDAKETSMYHHYEYHSPDERLPMALSLVALDPEATRGQVPYNEKGAPSSYAGWRVRNVIKMPLDKDERRKELELEVKELDGKIKEALRAEAASVARGKGGGGGRGSGRGPSLSLMFAKKSADEKLAPLNRPRTGPGPSTPSHTQA